MEPVLTLEEVAEYLKVGKGVVQSWVEEGRLPAFRVEGAWRIRAEDLTSFLEQKIDQDQGRILAKKLTHPDTWAAALEQDSELAHEIESGEHSPNTMGRFLQDALRQHRAKMKAGNVVDFPPRDDES